jgi:hypothetical protein
MAHELVSRHDPHVYHQVRSCMGDEHATHRELTGWALYFCNCGYSSGWVEASTLPPPTEFIHEHRPDWAVGL